MINSKENLLLLAQYNVWATQRLVEALAPVSDQHFYQDTGLFFNSIFGTLNHLLLGEHRLWYARFALNQSPVSALNQIVHSDRNLLLNDLRQKSNNWVIWLNQLDQSVLQGNLNYKTASGQAMCLPFAATLLHVFNHGTHHRGQITAAMTALGYGCPELDLVYMLVELQAE